MNKQTNLPFKKKADRKLCQFSAQCSHQSTVFPLTVLISARLLYVKRTLYGDTVNNSTSKSNIYIYIYISNEEMEYLKISQIDDDVLSRMLTVFPAQQWNCMKVMMELGDSKERRVKEIEQTTDSRNLSARFPFALVGTLAVIHCTTS